MPTPREDESRDDFVSRCIPIVLDDGSAGDRDQAVAMCNSIWENRKMADANESLIKAIRARGTRREKFGHGILTADMHVRRMLDCVGLQTCYQFASTGGVSFDDVLRKAARTLTYGNSDMEIEDVTLSSSEFKARMPKGVESPKNALAVFRHVLTTSRKDRDGDVLHSEGAEVDPRMLLLWQHVHTLPIGKYLGIAKQNTKMLSVVSAIIDINDLCHDAAVMVDAGMGKFSHGFRALEFSENKGDDGEDNGFDVKRFEIMEESIVSVPANPDAETEEVLLSMVEGGKLTSLVMREYGKTIKDRRPLTLPVSLDLKVSVNGRELKNEDERRAGAEAGGEKGAARASEKADGGSDAKAEEAGDEEGVKAPAVSLYGAGRSHAAGLVSAGKVKRPDAWAAPSAAKQNAYVEENGMAAFAKWHMGKAAGGDEESKGTWKYPYTSDFTNVDRQGIVAIRQRAGQQKEQDIFDAAGKLLEKIDEEGKGLRTVSERREDFGDGAFPGHMKRGRVLSKANEDRIRDARDSVDEASKMEIPKGAKALLREASSGLKTVLDSLGEEGEAGTGATVKEAIAKVLADANRNERIKLLEVLGVLENAELQSERIREYRALVGS